MQENNLKGLWIPYEILTNENLSELLGIAHVLGIDVNDLLKDIRKKF